MDGADSDSDGSNLSDLEYELLGMERPEKKKSPPRKAIPKKRVKLNEAFRCVSFLPTTVAFETENRMANFFAAVAAGDVLVWRFTL